MTECSNCWQPISLIPGSYWWVYFTWRLFLLLILLLLALAGGSYFTRMLAIAGPLFHYCWHLLGGSFHQCAGNCWCFILLLLALAGGFISLGCWQLLGLYFTIAGTCWGLISLGYWQLLGPYFTIHCNCWGFYFT